MITFGGILILITQAITLLVALCGLIAAILSIKSSRTNKAAINRVEISIDGRLSELLALNKKAAHAEGVKAEKDHPT